MRPLSSSATKRKINTTVKKLSSQKSRKTDKVFIISVGDMLKGISEWVKGPKKVLKKIDKCKKA